MSSIIPKDPSEGSSRSVTAEQSQNPAPLSRYESQKRRDWNTFGQYLKNQRPPVSLSQAAYEENGGSPENNPFGNGAIRVYLREVKECQAKARGIPYKKKKKRKNQTKANDEMNASKLQAT
nr:hypothetical protein [Tanacetum cinerariifolium]